MSNFPAISLQEQVTFRGDDKDIVPFVLDEYSQLNFYSCCTWTHYPHSSHSLATP